MPWHKPSHRVVRLSTCYAASASFEKLEDRVAVAATATLAASGIIFDGAPQLFATNEPPPLSRTAGSGGAPPAAGHWQDHKADHHRHGKGAGGSGGHRSVPSHHGHKTKSDKGTGGAKGEGTSATTTAPTTTTNNISSSNNPNGTKTSGSSSTTSQSSGLTATSGSGISGGGGSRSTTTGAAAPTGSVTNVTLDANATWTTSINGGTAGNAGTVVRDASGFTLNEGDSFRVAVGETFTVPASPGQLSFSYDPVSFQRTDDFVHDAFEVSLLNPATNEPLVPAFAAGR